MDFSPDQANPYYDPNYNTPDPKSSDERKARIERREKALKGRMPPRIIPRDKIKEAAEAMEHESSLDQSRKSCTGIFCRLFSGGKRRTKKRRKKRRTKSRRKTKRRRKSRRRTKRRRRKR